MGKYGAITHPNRTPPGPDRKSPVLVRFFIDLVRIFSPELPRI